MRNWRCGVTAIVALTACAEDPTAPTEIYLNIAATLENIDRVVLTARTRGGTYDVIETRPADIDINIDPLTVRLTPSAQFDLEIILRAEGYRGDRLFVATGSELTFEVANRLDLEITMNEGFASDDQDRDGYRLCGTGAKNDKSPCDCDDANLDVNPFELERCGDGVDDDCTGVADDGC